ncbi:hypothetical protein MKW94_027616 [Papaver nudicaule]|uniref:Uncharacterized protein n=1 Tax=Papaver nudicaule TaxID=74823 RepID=A0AA41VBP4_PAPNU|nr:hypothetical protein [Papaver nudicaule]
MAFSSLVLTLRKAFSSVAFTVRRREPELIVPAKPTPCEFKYLSDIDDRKGNRSYSPTVHFFRSKKDPLMASTCNKEDMVGVIRKALANTLVFYYPFAGRLREAPRGKLLVECTGQGVYFVEADAEVSLNQLGGDDLKPPFPYLEQLLCAPGDSEDILFCPLIHNHTICDAQGLHQFKRALAEIARGHLSPSIVPVWERHLLNAREPPQVSFAHREYDHIMSNGRGTLPCLLDDMVQRSFFFGPNELASLRQHAPHQACTTFELLTAWLWRCRTIAIGYDPEEDVRVVIAVDARGKFHPPLPIGFYGNAIADPVAVSTAEELTKNPLSFAIELVKKAKNGVNEEYIRSTADLMATKGRPIISTERTYFVSDLRRVLNGDEVDFGCGEVVQVYSGTAISIPTSTSWMSSVYISYKNNKGDKGILPVSLPSPAMKKFVMEIESTYNG